MRKLFLFLLVLPLATFASSKESKTDKATKAVAEVKAFQKICELVKSKQFQVEIDKVYPQDGFDMTRFNPQGKITVTDSIAKGCLPYFGRAYSLSYGEGGGIEFEDQMQKVKTQMIKKRKKKSIVFGFSVHGNKDYYQISIEVMANGQCNVQLYSNNRSSIVYGGMVTPLGEKS